MYFLKIFLKDLIFLTKNKVYLYKQTNKLSWTLLIYIGTCLKNFKENEKLFLKLKKKPLFISFSWLQCLPIFKIQYLLIEILVLFNHETLSLHIQLYS